MSRPLDLCHALFACVRRAALTATPEELERMKTELRHLQTSLDLISGSRLGNMTSSTQVSNLQKRRGGDNG